MSLLWAVNVIKLMFDPYAVISDGNINIRLGVFYKITFFFWILSLFQSFIDWSSVFECLPLSVFEYSSQAGFYFTQDYITCLVHDGVRRGQDNKSICKAVDTQDSLQILHHLVRIYCLCIHTLYFYNVLCRWCFKTYQKWLLPKQQYEIPPMSKYHGFGSISHVHSPWTHLVGKKFIISSSSSSFFQLNQLISKSPQFDCLKRGGKNPHENESVQA